MKNKHSEWFTVFTISFIVAVINILHVIVGYAKTLPGQVYMATGHYYLDYFEYLQALSQGWHGHWLSENYYGADIKIKTFFGMWQYLIIGHVGKFFGLSQITTYWLSIIIFSIILSLLIFFVIRKILIDKPFYWQLSAYILALFAAPFFKIISQNNQWSFLPFRFWSDKAVLNDRFGYIPYHLTDQIITLLLIILIANILDHIKIYSRKELILKSLIIIFLFTFLLTFSPAYFLLGVCSLSISLVWYIISKQSSVKIKFLTVMISVLTLIGFFTKILYIDKVFSGISKFESTWQVHPSLYFFVLSTGPIILFIWFGIKNYLAKLSSIKLIMLNFAISSYILFFSPLASYFGTTNMRFFSPLNYILLGVLAVSGVKKLRSLIIISVLLIVLFIPGNLEGIKEKINDRNLSSPISYLPKGTIEGYKFLKSLIGDKIVLTTPAEFLGTIVPVYSDKTVYLTRPGQSGYDQKVNTAARFYLGLMSDNQAIDFLQKNNIGYITLSSIESYPLEKLRQYKFLQNIYQNQDIVIFSII